MQFYLHLKMQLGIRKEKDAEELANKLGYKKVSEAKLV